MPTNLYGPGDKFHPAVSHVIPALIKKCVDAKEGADHIEVGARARRPASSCSWTTPPRHRARRRALRRGAEPVNLGTDEELPIRDLVKLVADATGFEGEIRWDTSKPDGQPRRRVDPAGRPRPSASRLAPTSPRGSALTVD